ncbi:type 1 glutamine amidotransferase domain-containing protein [Alkalibacillus salilacus]|uniref:Protease I n=1 Tax=Alkalibacillus salilacus TaxID=284582 RepID=A0ABT9VGA0_9BACI|nr:type 1 glutamine amidotransferase domain-containing protein [Alkalibacillus salilacus]MDQ0160000.1 protease I [Alkalibacillus salilacus]
MGKKVAALLTDMVEEIELTDPAEKLRDAGHQVDLIGKGKGETIKGKNGQEMTLDYGVDDVDASDYDALLVPGGFSPDLLRIDEKNAKFARQFFESDKPVFAICHAPQFLVDTEQLKGKTLTSFVSVRNDLRNAGAKVVDEEVVVDGKFVTSRTPDDLPAFNREALKQLEG